MNKFLKWLGAVAIRVLISGAVKEALKQLWDKYDDFNLFYEEFINLIKKI